MKSPIFLLQGGGEGRGGGFTKNKYIGENCLKKGGLGQFPNLRGAWRKRGGGLFEGRVAQ